MNNFPHFSEFSLSKNECKYVGQPEILLIDPSFMIQAYTNTHIQIYVYVGMLRNNLSGQGVLAVEFELISGVVFSS